MYNLSYQFAHLVSLFNIPFYFFTNFFKKYIDFLSYMFYFVYSATHKDENHLLNHLLLSLIKKEEVLLYGQKTHDGIL